MSQSVYDSASDDQRIAVKMRPDLQVQKIYYQSEPWWVVKDPHDQEYYQFNEHEFAILSWLDGKVSFIQLREKFEKRFSPFRVNFRDLAAAIREFAKKSVVASTTAHNALELHEFSREKKRKKLQKKLKNVLAIKWRGWDPGIFMDLTYPLFGWFFSKAVVIFNMLFFLTALGWLFANYGEFVARMPSLWSLLDASNLVTLGLTICITKFLHELGHGYVHKRFGGECHEIGVMIFFLMPTLYCNTSDSWMLTDKWKRMAIGAAGVYVETFIFSVATFVWWYSGVGLVQDVCMNLMVICSISAALTNGNPLMKYDGYFVLGDWLEIPNLTQRANKEIRRVFLNGCLGIESETDLWTSRYNKRIYVLYGIASFLFKALLIIAISYFLIQKLQFAGLTNFGLLIAVIALISIFIPIVTSMYKYFKQPGKWQRVRRSRLLLTSTALAVLIGVVCLVPFPFSVPAECSVELSGQQTVYAESSGRIEKVFVQPGETVAADQPLLQLADETLKQEIYRVESELAEIELQLKHRLTPQLEGATFVSTVGQSLSSLEITKEKLDNELAVFEKQSQSLLVRAPQAGVVYGVTIGDRQADTDDQNLNQIFGNPLSTSNRGAYLEKGDAICRIGDDQQPEIVLLVEQKQNGLIRKGQEVSVLLSSLGDQRLNGHIEAVSLRENRADDLPDPIFQGSNSPMIMGAKRAANANTRKDMEFKDGQTLASTMIQATVSLDADQIDYLNFASVGKVKIFVGNRTLFWRMKRGVNEIFQRSF